MTLQRARQIYHEALIKEVNSGANAYLEMYREGVPEDIIARVISENHMKMQEATEFRS